MARYKPMTAPDPKETGWPGGVPYIIGNEGCERFSFYGMKAILYVYLVGLYINYLSMAKPEAESSGTATYHLFVAAVYAFPIIGALLADRVLGKYKTIIWLSLVYCAGHAALALFESDGLQRQLFGQVFIDPVQGMYLGLVLIGIGSGGIKPCVSAHVGDQFGPGNWHLLQKVFNAFYFIINFGSAFSTLIIPWIRGERRAWLPAADAADATLILNSDTNWFYSGPELALKYEVHYSGSVSWAFAVPGILMGLATIFFWMGRKKFVHVPASQPFRLGILDFLSGSALFAVVAIPIFGYEIVHQSIESKLVGTEINEIKVEDLEKRLDLFSEAESAVEDERANAVQVGLSSGSSSKELNDANDAVASAIAELAEIEPLSEAELAAAKELEARKGKAFSQTWLYLGISMVVGFGLFAGLFFFRQRLKQDDSFLAVMFYCFSRVATGKKVEDESVVQADHGGEDPEKSWLSKNFFFGHAVRRFGLATSEGPVAVLKISIIFSFVSLFWALFDQHSSTWIKQAEGMDRNVEFSLVSYLIMGVVLALSIGGAVYLTFRGSPESRNSSRGLAMGGFAAAIGFAGAMVFWYVSSNGYVTDLEPSQIPAANPFMVMLLIPYCNFGLYPLMAKFGLKPTPLRRMSIGMMMTGMSFVAVSIIQWLLDTKGEGSVHVFWQLIPFLVLTTSEVMVSITGLEFAYSQAPKKMKSVIMGLWLFSVTIGNVMVTLTAGYFEKLDLLPFFIFFATAMFISATLFGITTMFYRYKDYPQ